MRIIAVLMALIIFTNSCQNENDWKKDYLKQEKTKITTIVKTMDYNSGTYSITSIDSTFETFNVKRQKIRNHLGLYCNYDKNGRLITEKYSVHKKNKSGQMGDFMILTIKSLYNKNGLLIKKVFGDKISTDEFSYDELYRKKTKTRRFYNEKEGDWSVFIDTIFYKDNSNNIAFTNSYLKEDVLMTSKYTYNIDNTLKSQVNTTITNDPNYDLSPRTIFNYNYCRIDFKYNSSKKLIEKIWSRPDCKTPYQKMTYEYIETQIK